MRSTAEPNPYGARRRPQHLYVTDLTSRVVGTLLFLTSRLKEYPYLWTGGSVMPMVALFVSYQL